jgi:hypothetical protein
MGKNSGLGNEVLEILSSELYNLALAVSGKKDKFEQKCKIFVRIGS